MTQQPDTCTATLRAETGPCETCGFDSVGEGKTVHNMDLDLDTDLIATGFIYTGPSHHPYLGPLLGVCGHAEDQHEDVTFTLTVCKGCVPMGETFFTWHRDAPNEEHPGAHAFTTEEPADG